MALPLRGALVGLASVASLFAFCARPTEIVVDVYTEAPCEKSPRVSLTTAPAPDQLADRAPASMLETCAPVRARAGRVVLKPSNDKGAPLAFQITTRIDGLDPATCADPKATGCITARRQLRFAEHESTELAVHLRLACVDRPCTPETTCVNGACVSALVPERCEGNSCGEEVLQATGATSPGDAATAGDALAPSDGAARDAGDDGPSVVKSSSGPVDGIALMADGGLAWIEIRDGGLTLVSPSGAISLNLSGDAGSLSERLDGGFLVSSPTQGRRVSLDGSVSFQSFQNRLAIASTRIGDLGVADFFLDRNIARHNPVGTPDQLCALALDAGGSFGHMEAQMLEGVETIFLASAGGVVRVGSATINKDSGLFACSTFNSYQIAFVGEAAVGVSASPSSKRLCVSLVAGGIRCLDDTAQPKTLPVTGPVRDVLLVDEGQDEILYYAAPPGIWRLRIAAAGKFLY